MPAHHRHRRELAIALLLAGDPPRPCESRPSLGREARHEAQRPGAGGRLAACGEAEAARRHVAALKAETPGLTLETARLPCFGDRSAGERSAGC